MKKQKKRTFLFSISHFLFSRFRRRRGFFLVEVMVALGVVVVGFLGIVALLSSSLGVNRQVADTYVANYLAMEGVETVKNLIDANYLWCQNPANSGTPACKSSTGLPTNGWNCGFVSGGNFEIAYDSMPNGNACPGSALTRVGSSNLTCIVSNSKDCLFLDDNGVYGYSNGGQQTRFDRLITIDISQPSSTVVKSTVYWIMRGGASNSVELDDVFWNWRP